jgi:hypothetical protein
MIAAQGMEPDAKERVLMRMRSDPCNSMILIT